MKTFIFILILLIPHFVTAGELENNISLCKMLKTLNQAALDLRKSDVPFDEAALHLKEILNGQFKDSFEPYKEDELGKYLINQGWPEIVSNVYSMATSEVRIKAMERALDDFEPLCLKRMLGG